MADKWLVKNGNTSDPTVWNDGTLPGATDDCYADGFTGTIDADLTVASVRTTQRTGGTAGGGWELAGGVTLTADVYAGTTICVTFAADSPAKSTIIGTSYGSTTSGGVFAWDASGSGDLDVVGEIVNHTGAGNPGARISGTGRVSIIGDLVSRASYSSGGGTNAVLLISGVATVSIVGSVIGGRGQIASAVLVTAAATVNVTGEVVGGATSTYLNSSGIVITSTANVTITGSLSANGAPAVYTTAACNISHVGAVAASSGNPAIYATVPSTIVSTGPFENVAGIMAVYAPQLFLADTSSVHWTFTTSDLLTDRTLYSADTLPGQPAESDVRKGTVYGPSSELTGTLAVPPASAVGVGVPVDNTVGTAAVTTAAIQAALTSQGLTEARAGYLDKLNVEGDLANTGNADSFKATGFAVPGSPMTLTSGERNAVADAVLSRDVANAESSAAEHSLCTIVLASLESSISGTTWTIKRTDGETTHAIKTLTTDKTADPITGVS
jgi:hypothetical protein